jgi:hypothetical protein
MAANFPWRRRRERFHRNSYRARIIKVVFLEEKPRKRSSLLEKPTVKPLERRGRRMAREKKWAAGCNLCG